MGKASMYIRVRHISENHKSRVGLGIYFTENHRHMKLSMIFTLGWLLTDFFWLSVDWLALPTTATFCCFFFFLFYFFSSLFPSIDHHPRSLSIHILTHNHTTYKMAGGYTRFGPLPKPHVSRIHNFIAKGLGATMWFWIFYRVREVSNLLLSKLKHRLTNNITGWRCYAWSETSLGSWQRSPWSWGRQRGTLNGIQHFYYYFTII